LTSYAQRRSCREQQQQQTIGVNTNATREQHCDTSNLAPIVGFDSFQGLPQGWKQFKAGSFGLNGQVPAVEANIQLEVGLFEDTLRPFLAKQGRREREMSLSRLPVGFVNIDNDLYEGALFILSQLQSRFEHGSVVHFHELFARQHDSTKCVGNDEMRALYYFLKNTEVEFNLQFMPYHVAYQEPAVFRVLKA
jgi:hypothetical protein